MKEFWAMICENLGVSSTAFVIILATFIQIAPIKINPWTAIKDYFLAPIKSLKKMEEIYADQEKTHSKLDELDTKMKKIDTLEIRQNEIKNTLQSFQNLETNQKAMTAWMDTMTQQVASIKNDREQDRALGARIRILQFGDEITNKVYHSKEHYEQILKDIKLYDAYCQDHPDFPNNITQITASVIKKSYEQLLLHLAIIQEDNNG